MSARTCLTTFPWSKCRPIGLSALLNLTCNLFAANQFKINLMFTGSRLPLYSYGALQIKLINHDGINETFTLTRLAAILYSASMW